ncbi:MAG: hypothetical protein WCG27_09325, partial [Pseudomonadota bacterium]
YQQMMQDLHDEGDLGVSARGEEYLGLKLKELKVCGRDLHWLRDTWSATFLINYPPESPYFTPGIPKRHHRPRAKVWASI